MSCVKNKCKKKTTSDALHHRTSNAVHYRGGTVEPGFHSSETRVDNDQHQDRRNLMNVLQSDSIQSIPILNACTTTKDDKTGECSKRGVPATVAFTTCSSDHHPNGAEEPFVNSDLLFNQEVSGSPSSSPPQLIGGEIALVDWMEQAQTILSRDKGQALPPYHGYVISASKRNESHGPSAFLPWGNKNNEKDGDEGFFEGKRFFYVVGSKTPGTLEDLSAVVNRSEPMFKMSRSA